MRNLLFLALLLGVPGPALPAGGSPSGDEAASRALALRNDKANRAAVLHLGVSLTDVEDCRRVGFHLYFSMFQVVIADEAGVPVALANEARLEGYTWGEMCRAWGVSLEKVRTRVDAAFLKMVDEGNGPPTPTEEEWRRCIATGKRRLPIPGKP